MIDTKRSSYIILLFLGFALLGCASEKGRQVVGPPTAEIMVKPPLATDEIDQEIAFLKGILDANRLEGDEQRAMAVRLLSVYREIKAKSQDRPGEGGYREMVLKLFDSLTSLDKAYFSKERQAEASRSGVIGLYSLKRKKIVDSYLTGDYQGVIDECAALEAEFGPQSLTPDIGIVFAFALAKKEMFREAVRLGEKILPGLEVGPGLIQLSSGIIEWQLALGNRERALQLYKKMMDQVDERESLVRGLGEKVAGAQKRIGDKALQEADTKELGSLETLMTEVNDLIQRGAFADAKLLLLRNRLKAGEGTETEVLDQAMKTVELAEDRYQQEKTANESYGKETLEQAVKLIEDEKFEEAVTKLDEFKDDPNLASNTREIRDIAIERLIKRESNRAANIFLTAKRTEDPAKKEELLLSVRNILKALIEKYPASDLNKKLNNYLSNVNEELEKLRKK